MKEVSRSITPKMLGATIFYSVNAFVLFELPKAVFEHIMSVFLRQQVPRCLLYAIRVSQLRNRISIVPPLETPKQVLG
jgi:hypothetical protein